MTQPSLLDLPEARAKVQKAVPRSSRLTYQAEHARLQKRSACVSRWLVEFQAAWQPEPPTSAELVWWVEHIMDDTAMSMSHDALMLFARRGLSDLQSARVAEKAGERKCRISGRTCATWRLTQR